MKGFACGSLAVLACGLCLGAQDTKTNTTTQVDINGNRVADGPSISESSSDGNSQTSVTTQSINGNPVPLEKVEVRVVRDDASGKVTERVVQRYDPQGNPLPRTREVIEEQNRPDGSSFTQSTTYTTDINGNTQVTEKSTKDTQKTSSGETTETTVQRPTVNGLETVEKQSEVVNSQGKDFQSESTTYRRDGNGGFFAAVRQTTEHKAQGSESTENSAEYERGPEGDLQLHGQTVSRTVSRPDGSKDTVVDVYSRNVPGVVTGNESGLKLEEQQSIQTVPGPGNTVVQTLSVRRPTVSDPGTLGPERQLSQTVCKGDCTPRKEKNK